MPCFATLTPTSRTNISIARLSLDSSAAATRSCSGADWTDAIGLAPSGAVDRPGVPTDTPRARSRSASCVAANTAGSSTAVSFGWIALIPWFTVSALTGPISGSVRYVAGQDGT